MDEITQLNYTDLISIAHKNTFEKMHQTPWEEEESISQNFQLQKQQKFFKEIKSEAEYNIIYFDAFGPRVQPELWTESVFKTMYKALKTNGVLVTYCAQGYARRAMISVGFTVHKIEGPPGKRHMLRAVKI